MIKVKKNIIVKQAGLKKTKILVFSKQEKKIVKPVVVLSPLQVSLKKNNFPIKGRILKLIAYFQKNKPVENKLYQATEIYKGASSLPQIGTEGQRYMRQILGYKVIGKLAGTNPGIFKTFTLEKITKK